MKRFCFFIIFFLFFLLSSQVYGDEKIKINEFTIEPEQTIEIVNTTDESLDISGWYIDDSGGNTYFTIPEDSIIDSNSCMIFTGSFNLNKSSTDTIRLFDNLTIPTASSSGVIDSYTYSTAPEDGFSFSRVPDRNGEFKITLSSLGKWNESDQTCLSVPTPSPTPSPTQIPIVTNNEDEEEPIGKIFLSEVMVRPPVGESEWIEIYNGNGFPVTLENWYIDDQKDAGSLPKKFSALIDAYGYTVIEIEASIFNNSGDTTRLLDPLKKEVESFQYTTAVENKTLGRENFDIKSFCIQEPSREFINNSCLSLFATTTPTKTPTPTRNLSPAKTINDSKTRNLSSIAVSKNQSIKERGAFHTNSKNTPQVLGAKTIAAPLNNNPLIKALSFLSASYSLLTITSILLKIKFGYD